MCGIALTGSDRTERLPLNLQGRESWPSGCGSARAGPPYSLKLCTGTTWGRVPVGNLNLSQCACGSQGKSAQKTRQSLGFEELRAGNQGDNSEIPERLQVSAMFTNWVRTVSQTIFRTSPSWLPHPSRVLARWPRYQLRFPCGVIPKARVFTSGPRDRASIG